MAGFPNPAVPKPVRPSASASSTTTSQVRPGARPAVVVPRASTKPSSTVSGVPTGRPRPFGAGRGLGATVETRVRTTGAVIATRPPPRALLRGGFRASTAIVRLVGQTSQHAALAATGGRTDSVAALDLLV